MSKIYREWFFYLYMILTVVFLFIFIVSSNDLLFHYNGFINNGLTFQAAGNWNYWIFILSLIMAGIFAYYTYEWFRDDRFFNDILNSDSKSKFIKNMRDLEKIARKHGPSYEERLDQKKSAWKIRQ